MSKERHSENASAEIGSACPRHLLSVNQELLDFAKNFRSIIAKQSRKGCTFAFSSEEISSVPEVFNVIEDDVRNLPGFKTFAAVRDAYSKKSKHSLREMVFVQKREGETDIVVGVVWNVKKQ